LLDLVVGFFVFAFRKGLLGKRLLDDLKPH